MFEGCVQKSGAFAVICFLAAIFGCSSGAAAARDITSLEVDASGTCDEARLKDAGFKRPTGYTFVLKPGPILTVNSTSSAETVEAEAKVFDRADLYAEDPKSGKIFVAIGDGENSKLCGWVAPVKPKQEADGLTKPLLMRDGQLKKRPNTDDTGGLAAFVSGPRPMMVNEGPEAKNNPENPLGLKAVITNLDVSGPAGVPVYTTPDATKSDRSLKFFDIFEIFDWVEVTRARAPAPGRDGSYYLIGTRRKDTLELHGWIRDTDVYLWNSRMAVYWRTEASGAYPSGMPQMKVYKGIKQLEDNGPHMLLGPKPGQENIDDAGGVHRRYPVLEITPDEESIEAEIKKLALDRDKDRDKIEKILKYIKISAPGEACNESGKDCISSYAVDAGRKILESGGEKSRNIDILFVVDGTASMDPYLKPIAGALSRFVGNSKFDKKRTGKSVHFALYTYGDYKGGTTEDFDGKSDIDFEEAGPQQVEKFQKLALNFEVNGLPYGDLQEDLPEAAFKALIAASQSPWRKEAGVRLIVHITDHGNREYLQTSDTCSSKFQETVSAGNVVTALKKAGIGYIPIAVLGAPGGGERRACRQKFREQARRLVEALAPRSIPLETVYDIEREEENTGRQEEEIYKALERSVDISSVTLAKMAAEKACSLDKESEACIVATKKANEGYEPILKFAQDLKESFTEDEAKRIYSGRKQTVVQGYLRPFANASDPKSPSTLGYWVAMGPGSHDVKQAAHTAQAICTAFTRDETRSDIARGLKDDLFLALHVTSGDPSASPAELLSKRMFIPMFHLSSVLSQPWDDIEGILNSKQPDDVGKVRDWSRSFCKKAYLLDLVSSDLRAFSEPELQKGGGFSAKDVRSFSWVFNADQGLKLYYVPIEYLP